MRASVTLFVLLIGTDADLISESSMTLAKSGSTPDLDKSVVATEFVC